MRSIKSAAYALAGVGAMLVMGCDDGGSMDVIEIHGEKKLGTTWEDYRRNAEVTVGGRVVYLVEDDLLFTTEAALRGHYEEMVLNDGWKLAVFQRISTGEEPVFSRTDALDITYCVSNLFQSSFQPFDKNRVVTEAATAMRDWQRVVNVRFRYVPSEDTNCTETNANVDFAIIPIPQFGGCALNKMMWGGPNSWCPNSSGAQVMTGGMVGMNYGGIGTTPSSTGVFRHELGHLLGFRHEHPWKPGTLCTGETPTMATDDLTGRRLTAYDSVSVMHYTVGSCAPAPTEYVISQLDGVGARSIYGMPTSWVMAILD